MAAGGRRRHPAGPRLLDVRLLLPAGPRRRSCRSTPRSSRRPPVSAPAGGGRCGGSSCRISSRRSRGAALLTFMTALGSFSAPYVFGGGFRVMPTQIVATRLNGENQLAMVETASLAALALLALLLFRTGSDRQRGTGRKGAGPGAGRDRRAGSRGCWRACGLGARAPAAAAAPDAGAGVVRAGGHLDHRAAAAGVHAAATIWRWWRIRCGCGRW